MLGTELQVAAVIFDLDGVLVDSSAVVDETWVEWGAGRGLELELIRRTIPGKRTRDAVVLLAPDSDADAETARLIAREASLVDRVTPIPGARALLAQIPWGRWGIATSGTNAIARGRLAQAGLPVPEVLITAELVEHGKPHPESYLRAASGLSAAASACAVFEDAPSGVAAATAAGALVVGVLTWAKRGLLATPYAVTDLRAVAATVSGGQIRLRLEAAL